MVMGQGEVIRSASQVQGKCDKCPSTATNGREVKTNIETETG